MIEELGNVKKGLEVFGVEKRLEELENMPRILQGKGATADISGLLKLNQTTPQTVTGGAPKFDNGLIIKAGQKLIFDGD